MFDLIGSISKAFGQTAGLIDKIHTSTDEKNAAKIALKQIQLQALTVATQAERQLIEAQSKIITAEAQGTSWLQRNWRPLLMATCIIILAMNYVVRPYILVPLFIAFGVNADEVFPQNPLPDKMWGLLTLGVGGYIAGRSGEKIIKGWNEKRNGNNK